MPILGLTVIILFLCLIFKPIIFLFSKFNFNTSVFVRIVKLGLFFIGFKKTLDEEVLKPLNILTL